MREEHVRSADLFRNREKRVHRFFGATKIIQ